MSKQTEALKLAIEVFGGGDWHDEIVDTDWADKANNAITVLREALAEQPAQQEPVAWMQDSIELYVQDRPSAIYTIPLYTTPQAQPAREPLTDEKYEAIVEDLAGWGCYVEGDRARQSLEKHVREVLTAHGITKGNT